MNTFVLPPIVRCPNWPLPFIRIAFIMMVSIVEIKTAIFAQLLSDPSTQVILSLRTFFVVSRLELTVSPSTNTPEWYMDTTERWIASARSFPIKLSTTQIPYFSKSRTTYWHICDIHSIEMLCNCSLQDNSLLNDRCKNGGLMGWLKELFSWGDCQPVWELRLQSGSKVTDPISRTVPFKSLCLLSGLVFSGFSGMSWEFSPEYCLSPLLLLMFKPESFSPGSCFFDVVHCSDSDANEILQTAWLYNESSDGILKFKCLKFCKNFHLHFRLLALRQQHSCPRLSYSVE